LSFFIGVKRLTGRFLIGRAQDGTGCGAWPLLRRRDRAGGRELGPHSVRGG